MRVSPADFANIQRAVAAVGGWARAIYQFAFVALADPPSDISPLFPEARRLWAVVDDPDMIAHMRTVIVPASCVYVDGQPRRVDYDPEVRPTLIIHDVE